MSEIINDPRIDAGIESYPLADLPDGFIERTMARATEAKLVPRFRLRFTDLAVPVFFVVFSLSLGGLGLWVYKNLDQGWFEYVKLKIVFLQLRYFPTWGSALSINLWVLGLVFLIIMEIIWLVSRPRRITDYSFYNQR